MFAAYKECLTIANFSIADLSLESVEWTRFKFDVYASVRTGRTCSLKTYLCLLLREILAAVHMMMLHGERMRLEDLGTEKGESGRYREHSALGSTVRWPFRAVWGCQSWP